MKEKMSIISKIKEIEKSTKLTVIEHKTITRGADSLVIEVNDKFLKDILKSYGASNDKLFKQIKELAIIDPMNWFWSYYKEDNSKGQERMIKKIKKILKKQEKYFSNAKR